MTGGASTTTLAQRVNGLVGRYAALSADRRTQAKGRKSEASYLYGAAAAFEVVATELWEALGKHGAMPRVAQTPQLLVLAERLAGMPSVEDHSQPVDLAEATGRVPLDDGGTT